MFKLKRKEMFKLKKGLCSIKADSTFKRFLASTIGNSIVYSIMVVIMSSHLSPYLAGKFTAFKFGKLQSLKRSKTEVGLILLIQTCIDLSPAFAIGLVDESCLRYYIKFVGGLETLVQSDRFPSCFSYSNGLATNIYHLLTRTLRAALQF